MIDITKLPEDVLNDIRENCSDSKIKNLSVEDAFEAFCNWQSLIGFAPTLIRGLDAIRAASDEKSPAPSKFPQRVTLYKEREEEE